MFPWSTQKRHWMFSSSEALDDLRRTAHHQCTQRLLSQRKLTEDQILTLDEETALLRYMLSKLQDFCTKFKPPMPKGVQGTAAQYFKRFYLNNSCMEYHPKEMLLTAIYLACKVEEFNVSIEQYIANVSGNKEHAMDIVLSNELLLMKELKYHLTVHNAFRAVEGVLIDVKTRLPDLSDTAENFRPEIVRFLDDIYYTDAFFLYAPSQIALAAVIHAASKTGTNVDRYVTEVLFGGDLTSGDRKTKLSTLVTAVRNVRVLAKNLKNQPPLDGGTVKKLMEKLEYSMTMTT